MIIQKKVMLYSLFFLFLPSCSLMPQLNDAYSKFEEISKQQPQDKLSEEVETSPIIDGEVVTEVDSLRDSISLIKMNSGNQSSICTAVLVNSNTLLTAAHCVHKHNIDEIKVVLFDEKSSQAKEYDVKNRTLHPQFNGESQSYSDLAIIKLIQPLSKTRKVIPIIKNIKAIDSNEVTLVGFGVTDEKLSDSQILRKVSKSFKDEVFLRGQIIGVGQKTGTGGFCRGDSGAPILVNINQKPHVLGINSFTIELEKGKECHSASVSISVVNNYSWISKNLN